MIDETTAIVSVYRFEKYAILIDASYDPEVTL